MLFVPKLVDKARVNVFPIIMLLHRLPLYASVQLENMFLLSELAVPSLPSLQLRQLRSTRGPLSCY